MVVCYNTNEIRLHKRSSRLIFNDSFTGRVKVYIYPLGNNRTKNKLKESELSNYIKRKI